MKLLEHGSMKSLGTVAQRNFGAWCDANGYLPHKKIKGGWIVIKK